MKAHSFQGAHLASIHSTQENNFIMVNLNRNSLADVFLGLFMNNDEQFEWSDGTVTDFFRWSDGGTIIHPEMGDTMLKNSFFIF